MVVPRQILGVVTRRRVAIAALAFALGALPLIVYNVHNRVATFRGNYLLGHQRPGRARRACSRATAGGTRSSAG